MKEGYEMENTIQFKDMVDIQKLTNLFEDLTYNSADMHQAVEKWSNAKSSNPTLVKMFKDSLIIGVPVEQTIVNKDYLAKNNIPQVFKDMFEPLEERVNQIIYAHPELLEVPEIKRYLSIRNPYDTFERVVYALVNQPVDNCVLSEWELNTIHYWIEMRDWQSISLSFFDGLDQSVRYLHVRNGIRAGIKINQGESFYRYMYRIIKKAFGKDSLEASEYNSLLTRLSLFKQQLSAKSHGENILCLSIHPADYLTVSEGNSWSSCYSLTGDGGGDYASAVSSTLISRDAVVAYVIPKEEYEKMQENNDYIYVPNKHWRTFVLINPKQMLLMKGYPYQAPTLFKQISDLVKQMSEIPYTFSPDGNFFIESASAYLDVHTPSKEEYKVGSWYKVPDFNTSNEFKHIQFAVHPFYWDNGEDIDLDLSGTDALFSWNKLEQCACCGNGIQHGDEAYDEETDSICCYECMELIQSERDEEAREAEEAERAEEEERELRYEYEENLGEQMRFDFA